MRYLIYLFLIAVISNSLSAQTNKHDTLIQSNKKLPSDSFVTKVQDSIPHAILYFYRSFISKLEAPLKKVPIFINDTLVHELKVNTVVTLKVFREGKYNIAAEKKSEEQTSLKVKFGKEYFFKCEVLGGLLNKRTLIYAVSPKVGKTESGVLTSN